MDGLRDGDRRLNLVAPVGYNQSRCGYCSAHDESSLRKTSKSFGIWAYQLKEGAYTTLIEHGWRRSGNYIYRPDCGYGGTCCAQFAIRLDVDQYRPTRQQKHCVAAVDRALRAPSTKQVPGPSCLPLIQVSARPKGKFTRVWDVEAEMECLEMAERNTSLLLASCAESEYDRQRFIGLYHDQRSQQARQRRKGEGEALRPSLLPHRQHLRTTLHSASSSDEKYELFRKYQAGVHKQPEDVISTKIGFERFLCQAPFMPRLAAERIDLKSEDPIRYGLFHMEWRLDGKLVALGVLDILPKYVSSVYFLYDPAYAHMQLGKLSALREIALVKQLRRKPGGQAMQYYTMGLYIHTCEKMRYKAQYGPAELLDPLTRSWHPLAKISQKLDDGQRFAFELPWSRANDDVQEAQAKLARAGAVDKDDKSNDRGVIDGSDDEDGTLPNPLPPGIEDPDHLQPAELDRCLVLSDGHVDSFPVCPV